MKVLILGGGEVGALVARRLIREKNEVVLVEARRERCDFLEDALDAKVVKGNATSIKTLEEAGLAEAEMMIAVTSSDEANILGCLIAQARSNVKIKVARLRTHEVARWRSVCSSSLLNVDLVIHPDSETAERMLRVIRAPGISEIHEFADGCVKLFATSIREGSSLVGMKLADLDRLEPHDQALVAMLHRGSRVIIPRGNEILRAGDHLYVVVPTEELSAAWSSLGIQEHKGPLRVFIVGGKQLGIEVALRLEKAGAQVKLFERDLRRCEQISRLVETTTVVHADGTDRRALLEENIEGIDAYMALTAHDEDNLIASLLAKRLGASKSVALVNRIDFLPIAQLLGVSSTFSTRLVIVDRILEFVRKGQVLSITTFREEEAEAIELIATPRSKLVGKRLRDIHLFKGATVGAIARPNGEVTVPRGEDVIEAGDRVVIFCLEKLVPRLESAFLVGSEED